MEFSKVVVGHVKHGTPRSSIRGVKDDNHDVGADVIALEGQTHICEVIVLASQRLTSDGGRRCAPVWHSQAGTGNYVTSSSGMAVATSFGAKSLGDVEPSVEQLKLEYLRLRTWRIDLCPTHCRRQDGILRLTSHSCYSITKHTNMDPSACPSGTTNLQ